MSMRAAAVGVCLVVVVGFATAQPEYTSSEGKYTVRFPDTPKVTSQTAKTAVGDLPLNIATYATKEGNAYMVSFTDFPATATKPENLGTLFEGIRDGAKGKDGKVAGDVKEITHGPDKLPGREFIIEKGMQRIKYRAILRDSRVYQIAALGTPEFVGGKEATAFLDSFQITK
jgi:hypothetical protein